MSANEQDYNRIADICVRWWRQLQELSQSGKEIPGKAPDRAALAQLRRIDIADVGGVPAVNIGYALGVRAFRTLIADFRAAEYRSWRLNRWLAIEAAGKGQEGAGDLSAFAIAATALAHIRTDLGGGLGATARLLGEGEGDSRLFAEARFKRLIRCRGDWPGLHAQARRIVAMLEKSAPVGDLGASLILWNADPTISSRWAFQYYRRDFAAPGSDPAAEAAPA